MASCKDCISEKVCRYNDGVNQYCKGDFGCPYYRDCSKIVELPCKVGDTVYCVKNYNIHKCNVAWIKIVTEISLEVRLLTKDCTFFDVSKKDFGKTVFLTREEAEIALEERVQE